MRDARFAPAPHDGFGFATLLMAALAFRLYGLDRWSLWLDETIQYHEAVAPLSGLYAGIHAQETFLSFLICRALIALGLDTDVWTLRLPFVIFGVLTVLAIWAFTNELFGRAAAWLAAALACVCPILIIYSQEFRFYGLFVLFSSLSFWTLATALRTNRWCVFSASSPTSSSGG